MKSRSLPSLQTLQSFIDIPLMELGHVGVHFWIVVPDVSLGTPVRHRAKPERRREVIGTLELIIGTELGGEGCKNPYRLFLMDAINPRKVKNPPLTFLSERPVTWSTYSSWIMKAARLAVYEARKMTAKKAQTETMILLVVPLGFWTGTELLKTRPQSSQMALPMVKDGPCGSERNKEKYL